MTGIAVIALNTMCSTFPNNVAFRWKDLSESIPIVGIEDAIFEVLYFVIEPSECCGITTAEHPGHSSPLATINGFDDP